MTNNIDINDARAALEALLEYDAQLEVKLHEARKTIDNLLNGPPAQMSYRGDLVPINANGMRTIIEDASAARNLLAVAGLALVKALEAERADRYGSDTPEIYDQDIDYLQKLLQQIAEFIKPLQLPMDTSDS